MLWLGGLRRSEAIVIPCGSVVPGRAVRALLSMISVWTCVCAFLYVCVCVLFCVVARASCLRCWWRSPNISTRLMYIHNCTCSCIVSHNTKLIAGTTKRLGPSPHTTVYQTLLATQPRAVECNVAGECSDAGAETSLVNVPSALAMLELLCCLYQQLVHGRILALIHLAATSLLEVLSCLVLPVCD